MPESMGGDVRPRPVAQITMQSPRWTGLVGVINWPLSARVMVARPVSGPAVPVRKMLGAPGRMEKLKLSLMPPGVRSVICALPSTLNGSCPLICWLLTNSTGTGTPFTVRQLSPSAVGSGISLVARLTGAICCP